ncbi:MAG: alpha/beta fold hydrolase [Deltaproteobacteria bacterium]|nr:alpha/beta fold hydrolase [Deltaproteobacteria bacterium]
MRDAKEYRRLGLRAVRIGGGAAAIFVAALMAACGQDTERIPGTFYAAPDPLPEGAPGQVIRTESTGTPPGGGNARRILYHSRTDDGRDIATSALFVLPEGAPPPGGFPLMVMAHGTAGLGRTCGVSVQPYTQLAAFGNEPQYDQFQPYVEAGFAVVAPDYQGLGVAGPPSYLVGRVEAQNVIDAAIAAHQLAGGQLSQDTFFWGHSQGGHSAAFAAEMLSNRSVPFRLLGTILVAPATLLRDVMQDVIDDDPIPQPGEAAAFLLFAAISYAETYPDLSLDQILTTCTPEESKPCGTNAVPIASQNCLETAVAPFLLMSEIGTKASAYVNFPLPRVWVDRLCQNDVGNVPMPSPVLMVQGTADTTLPVGMNCDYFENVACPQDVSIQFTLYPGATHTSVPSVAFPDILAWERARLAGDAAPSNCGSPPAFCGTVTPSEFCESGG